MWLRAEHTHRHVIDIGCDVAERELRCVPIDGIEEALRWERIRSQCTRLEAIKLRLGWKSERAKSNGHRFGALLLRDL